MHINKKYNYCPLSRIDTEHGRRYLVGEDRLPSVTTILSSTKDSTYLNEWVNRVGTAEANRIKTEASGLGTGMHANLENYMQGHPMSGSYMARALANTIIKQGLCNIDEIWGIEVSLYSPGLYAGTADLIGLRNGVPSIIDFKNSLREKELDQIDDYRYQLGAYALAHNEMYGTDIRSGTIMIATRDARYQEFVFEGSDFDKCIDGWLDRLNKYYCAAELNIL